MSEHKPHEVGLFVEHMGGVPMRQALPRRDFDKGPSAVEY